MTTAPPMSASQLAAEIKSRAKRLGFDLVGIAGTSPSKYRDYLRNWLDDGRAGTMQYLHNRFEERTDPSVYLPGAKSIICVAVNYNTSLAVSPQSEKEGKIAKYALGDDYHIHLKSKLHALADHLRELAPHAQTRACVDTAPVMEKELAARAGIGWLGKNTCIINPQIGSWLLLGEIITTLDLPKDDPAVDRCGTCRRCIDACPTHAITDEYQLDARKCISFLTIEDRSWTAPDDRSHGRQSVDAPLPSTDLHPELQHQIGNWLFGCDICQDVCPWNSKAPIAGAPELQPRFPTGSLDVNEVANWTDETYRTTLRNSAIKRIKLPILQRNAAIVATNLAARAQPKD